MHGSHDVLEGTLPLGSPVFFDQIWRVGPYVRSPFAVVDTIEKRMSPECSVSGDTVSRLLRVGYAERNLEISFLDGGYRRASP